MERAGNVYRGGERLSAFETKRALQQRVGPHASYWARCRVASRTVCVCWDGENGKNAITQLTVGPPDERGDAVPWGAQLVGAAVEGDDVAKDEAKDEGDRDPGRLRDGA